MSLDRSRDHPRGQTPTEKRCIIDLTDPGGTVMVLEAHVMAASIWTSKSSALSSTRNTATQDGRLILQDRPLDPKQDGNSLPDASLGWIAV